MDCFVSDYNNLIIVIIIIVSPSIACFKIILIYYSTLSLTKTGKF